MAINIVMGNTKLGNKIPVVNMPPIMTCRPGAPCNKYCYARKGSFLYDNVIKSHLNNLKEYCDMATDVGETVIVTRKADKNVVILSLERFNLMEKAIRNSQYLAKLDRAFDQLYAGKGQEHELIEE